MTQKHIVVVGTGAGGLAAAAHLARDGFKVTALERAQQFGGFLNPFARKKFEFDPGVHYLGECRPGQMYWQFYKGLGVDPEGLFAEMDPDGFDVYRFPDFEIRMGNDIEVYKERLIAAFPRQANGIEKFIHDVKKMSELQTASGRLQSGKASSDDIKTALGSLPLARWGRSTFGSYLDSFIDDGRLKDVLAGACGDYGLPPSRASALYGLALVAHYSGGGFFPVGGSRRMRDAILDVALENGAEFRRNTEVTGFEIRAGKVQAVVTAEGEEITCDAVISAVSPRLTFEKFVGAAHLPARLTRKSQSLEPSLASFCVFLGMDRDLTDYGLGKFNIWHYPHWGVDAAYAPYFRGEMPDQPPFFLSPNSLKDPSGSLAPAGSSTLEIVTFAPYEMFKKWDGGRAIIGREADYKAFKDEMGEKFLSWVDTCYPGLIGDVKVKEFATPVSNTHYVNSIDGGIYGPAATPDQSIVFRFQTRTPISNLFLAGSGVFGGGVSPALSSGKVAAKTVRAWARGDIKEDSTLAKTLKKAAGRVHDLADQVLS